MSSKDKENADIWEEYKPEQKTNLTEEEEYVNLLKECNKIYPKIDLKVSVDHITDIAKVNINSLLRVKMEDGKYYLSKIGTKLSINMNNKSSPFDHYDEIKKVTDKFHEFAYMNIICRSKTITESYVLDINQEEEIERIMKIWNP